MFLRVASLDETARVASALAELARPGDVIVLAGEMGAGKTAFAQRFGRALGVTEAITSPTFTLVHSYPTASPRVTLHHADLYRLDSTSDVEDLALHELAEFGGIVLVEWGDVASRIFGEHLVVSLSHADDDLDDDDDDDHADVASDERDADEQPGGDDRGLSDDDFSDTARAIEIVAVGRSWDGRWDRLSAALEGFRSC